MWALVASFTWLRYTVCTDVARIPHRISIPVLAISPGAVEGWVRAAFQDKFKPAHSQGWVFYCGGDFLAMIISMRPHATKEQIYHVCQRIREFGYRVHSIQGEARVVIGVVGTGDVTACLESLEATPGVESAVRISAPYKFVSREFKSEDSVIRINGLEIGVDQFIVMA